MRVAPSVSPAPLLRVCMLILALGAYGCPPQAPQQNCDAGTLVFELGTTLNGGYAPIREGQDLEFVMGPQGGFHVDGSARIWCIDVEGLLLRYQLHMDGTETPIAEATYRLSQRNITAVGTLRQRVGDRVLFPQPNPRPFVGSEYTLTATLSTADGTMLAESSRRVRLVDALP